jgi:hypothetical protein
MFGRHYYNRPALLSTAALFAVVTGYGRSYKDPNSIALPEAVATEGRARHINSGPVAVANGDSINSKHYLGKISSSAIMDPASLIYHTAITGLNTYHIGLELNGAVVNVNVLASALDLTVAGTKGVMAAVATANIGKRMWEIAGAAVDPGVEYDIVGQMNAGATAAGTIAAVIKYSKK